jgi:outer membrane protease
MKKSCFTLLLFLASGFFLHAQLSVGASIGLLTGVGEEIVYGEDNSTDKLSQLLWHFEPLVYAGVDLRYNWEVSFDLNIFANGLLKYGIPGKTGVMEDSDWTDDRYADWLTHYSVSENHTKTALLFDADAGVSFALYYDYQIRAFIAYRFMHYAWVARGGSLLYPRNEDGSEGHGYMTEPVDVVTYQQTWNIISPGVAFYGAFNSYFDIEISLKVSPFVWVGTIDEHLMRNLVITNELTGGLFIEPGLLFSFKPNDLMILSLSFSYRNISGPRGDSTYNQEGYPEFVAENMGGAGYSAFDIGIIARFTL